MNSLSLKQVNTIVNFWRGKLEDPPEKCRDLQEDYFRMAGKHALGITPEQISQFDQELRRLLVDRGASESPEILLAWQWFDQTGILQIGADLDCEGFLHEACRRAGIRPLLELWYFPLRLRLEVHSDDDQVVVYHPCLSEDYLYVTDPAPIGAYSLS